MIEIESKFYEEVHELECKYAAKYAPLFDRVCIIIMYLRVNLKVNIFIDDIELKMLRVNLKVNIFIDDIELKMCMGIKNCQSV